MANLKELIPDGLLKYDGHESTQVSDSKSTLTVIGWNGLKGNYSKHIVTCSVCSTDAELHGEGYFAISKGHLNRGIKPCGCSIKCNWTEEQYKVRLRRACEAKGIIFKGWKEGFSTANATKAVLECPKHTEYSWCTLSYALDMSKKSGCPGCKADNMGNLKRVDDKVMIDKFISSGGFAEGTQFRRSDTLNAKGHKQRWYMYCPDCDTENETLLVSLSNGIRSCACSKNRPQETYLNLVKDGDIVVAVKFGVANVSVNRVKSQNRASLYTVENYAVWKYPDVNSCRLAERRCMQELNTGTVPKYTLPDGYTETVLPADIDKVISIYEQCGGLRV